MSRNVQYWFYFVLNHKTEVALLIVFLALLFYMDQVKQKAINQYSGPAHRSKAQNPKIPKEYKFSVPQGIVIGKTGERKRRYFCLPELNDLIHCIIFGGSGSGKTSGPVMMTLLSNFVSQQKGLIFAFTLMVIDLKGELHAALPRGSYYLIDPTDREHSVGWDPYFILNREEDPDADLMIRVFSGIAASFVPTGNAENAFFTDNASGLLSGLLCWGYEHDIGMVDMVMRILTSSVPDLLNKCLQDSDEDDVSYAWLSKFQGKKLQESEAFQNFVSEMTTKLSCFKLSSVQYILRDNPRKIGPNAVRKKNVFLSVSDSMLTEQQFAPIFRMILEQEMSYLTDRLPPEGTKPVGLIIDELYAVGGGSKGKGIETLQKYLSIARGYGSFCVLALQGQAQLEQQYGKEGARIIMDNCRSKVILEASDMPTISNAIDMCGKYFEKNQNINDEKLTSTISWQEKDIFNKSDFLNLAAKKRIIVILQSGESPFYNIGKLQWFRDPYFKNIHDQIQKLPARAGNDQTEGKHKQNFLVNDCGHPMDNKKNRKEKQNGKSKKTASSNGSSTK